MAKNRHRRDATGYGLAALNKLAGWPLVERLGLRKTVERTVFEASKTGFRALGATTRAFATASAGRSANAASAATRPPAAVDDGMFDLTPTGEQELMRASTAKFAIEQLRPLAAEADSECVTSPTVLRRAASELGVTLLGVPEPFGGLGGHRSATANVMITEALAHGDMGQALAILAPAAVSGALVLWGSERQQRTYLPSFVTDNAPAAALALLEARPLFDPFQLRTRARRVAGGFQLDGVKSLVPRAAEAELFVIGAELDGRPALFIVESSSAGLTVEAEPAMGLRAASLGRVVLDGVRLPADAQLGTAHIGASKLGTALYADCVRLARLGWCALALGTAQAVLDYVVPYVNDREAFGEPVSHRQSVAFAVANIGIELEGMRLTTYRAASRAEQGKTYAREAALARTLCAEHGMQIGSNGVQLLGGHGFVKEHPVERWYRDLRAVGVMEGALLV
ncbi:MAG TPA: acyl-CoA dehydrogenase family protein [Jatrophihabitantaceae bacterium]|jgi:alkylation response protein AidB-like acyl-CoA dehydrogenase|nr:acyl-CoA dehydrogenase family protein [Jatrophihabitantaceae bacterium]